MIESVIRMKRSGEKVIRVRRQKSDGGDVEARVLKKMAEQTGAITLFMVFIVLSLLITFTGFMTYMTATSMENEGARYMKVASRSLLASFDPYLRDYYGLMAYREKLGETIPATIVQSCVENNQSGFFKVEDSYQIRYMPLCDITDLDHLADDMATVASYKVSEEIIGWAVDKVGLLDQVEKSGEVMGQHKSVESAMEKMYGTLASIYDQGSDIGRPHRGDYRTYLNRQMKYNYAQLKLINRLKTEIQKARRQILNYRTSIKRSSPEMLEEASKAMLNTCDNYEGILDRVERSMVEDAYGDTLSLYSYRNLVEDNITILGELKASEDREWNQLAFYRSDNDLEWQSLKVDKRHRSNLVGKLKQIYDTMTFRGNEGQLDHPSKHNEKLLKKRNLREEILINEYLLGTLQCAIASGPRAVALFPKQEREAVMPMGEVEYILKGYGSNRANAASVGKDIFIIRVVMNNLHILLDQEKMKTVTDLGVCLGGWTGLGVPIASFVIIEVWASAESALDVYELLEGEGVPFYKQDEAWRLSIDLQGESVMDRGRGSDQEGKEDEDPINMDFYYVDYLRLFLLTMDGEEKLNRFLDLLEANYTRVESEAVDLKSLIIVHELHLEYDYKSWNNGILTLIEEQRESNEVILIDGY